jgi:dTDP-4-amino-4,6-dideoxygalactose transaminase
VSVPFLDLERLHASIGDDLEAAFRDVIGRSAFVGAKASRSFEEAFAVLMRAPGAVGCGSGTDALALALRAVGIGPGDEVIVPSMTFVASAEAVVHVGATPVIADVDPETLLLTSETADEVMSARTKAVMPVHLYGHVVSFADIEKWKSAGLRVIEDAAQAHLATFDEQPVGQHSDVACFSFYPGKNLGALGDAGALISQDTALLDDVRQLRDHGRSQKYVHDRIGYCSRLDGLQAAFLEVKLGHLEAWTGARRRWAAMYRNLLADVADIALVPWSPGAVHHLLVIRVSADRRDAIQSSLAENGIETGIHYPVTLSQQPAMYPWARSCPVSERAASEVLSLPLDPLMSGEDVTEVVDALRTAI